MVLKRFPDREAPLQPTGFVFATSRASAAPSPLARRKCNSAKTSSSPARLSSGQPVVGNSTMSQIGKLPRRPPVAVRPRRSPATARRSQTAHIAWPPSLGFGEPSPAGVKPHRVCSQASRRSVLLLLPSNRATTMTHLVAVIVGDLDRDPSPGDLHEHVGPLKRGVRRPR